MTEHIGNRGGSRITPENSNGFLRSLFTRNISIGTFGGLLRGVFKNYDDCLWGTQGRRQKKFPRDFSGGIWGIYGRTIATTTAAPITAASRGIFALAQIAPKIIDADTKTTMAGILQTFHV